MIRVKRVIAVLFAVFMLFATGCTISNSKTIDFGTINNGTYTNTYFNISMQLPGEWILQSDKLNKKSSKASEEKAVDLSKEKTLTLIAAFKYPVMGEPEFNPSFISMADKITQEFKVQNGLDYLKGVKDSLIATQMPYEFSKDIYIEQVSTKEFYVLEAQINLEGFHVNQKSYAAVFDEYVLVFTFTYSSDEEYNELNNIIKSIKFN